MIKYAVGFVIRAMVELGLVFFLFGAILVFVAYRIGRLFVTPEPDRLDKLAAQLGTILGKAAIAQRAAAAVEPDELDDEPEKDFLGEVDWRELVV